MKKLVFVICALFLISTFGCATTKETVKLADGDFDLTGTWDFTEVVNGCGKFETNKSIVVITQNGDLVTAENKEKGWKWEYPAVDGIITIPKKKTGKVTVSEYQLSVLEGASTLTSKIKWDYDNGVCGGTSEVTYIRQ